MHRDVKLGVAYKVDDGPEYATTITVVPRSVEIFGAPLVGACAQSGRQAPEDCLDRCEITGRNVLRHLLNRSEISGRLALPEHTALCSVSNKRGLADELEFLVRYG